MTSNAEDTQTVAPADVAAWMLAEATSQESLWQTDAADEIGRCFGPEFIYEAEIDFAINIQSSYELYLTLTFTTLGLLETQRMPQDYHRRQ